MVFWLTSLRPI